VTHDEHTGTGPEPQPPAEPPPESPPPAPPESPRQPQVSAEPPQRRGGCLKGCLISLLVIVVLVAGCTGGAYLFGQRYIDRRLPEWEERHPWVGLYRVVRDARPSKDRLDAITEKEPGIDDKALFPGDIPLHPDATHETYSIGEDQGVAFQRVAEGPDVLESHVRERMPEHGWELSSEVETSEGRLLIWRKGDRICQTEIFAHEGESELWLRYTDDGSGQEE